jgi:hypothetical protein
MACDCGYSFVDGTPPRFGSERARAGGGAGSAFATRIAIRLVMMALGTALLLAIRMCGT